jgi:hypothetical protein
MGLRETDDFGIDNKGAKDLVNNWSVGGRLRHVEVKKIACRY